MTMCRKVHSSTRTTSVIASQCFGCKKEVDRSRLNSKSINAIIQFWFITICLWSVRSFVFPFIWRLGHGWRLPTTERLDSKTCLSNDAESTSVWIISFVTAECWKKSVKCNISSFFRRSPTYLICRRNGKRSTLSTLVPKSYTEDDSSISCLGFVGLHGCTRVQKRRIWCRHDEFQCAEIESYVICGIPTKSAGILDSC